MKKLANILFILLLLNLYSFPVSGQQVNLNQNMNMNSDIAKNAVSVPQTLPKWKPFPPEPPYNPDGPTPPDPPIPPGPTPIPIVSSESSGVGKSGGGSSMALVGVGIGASLPIAIGGGVLAIVLGRRHGGVQPLPTNLTLNPPITNNIDPTSTNYEFKFGEEILYNLIFKNSQPTPIYPDSVMYVKIPSWMEYIPQSAMLNNTKLTDKQDEDILTFYPDESMLVINIGNVDTSEGVVFNFGAKVLTQTVSRKEAFCLVKFQSPSMKYETDWQQLSILQNRPLPISLERVLERNK